MIRILAKAVQLRDERPRPSGRKPDALVRDDAGVCVLPETGL